MFLIAICRQSGDKWQSVTLFRVIFDLYWSIVFTFSIADYAVCVCCLELPTKLIEGNNNKSKSHVQYNIMLVSDDLCHVLAARQTFWLVHN